MSIRSSKRKSVSINLVGQVEQSKNGSATYTVAPDDAVGYDLMSQWITASTTDVQSLESMR